MDVVTIAVAVGVAAILLATLVASSIHLRRMSRAVDEGIRRLGAPASGGWLRRPDTLIAAIDRRESQTVQAERDRAQLAAAIQSAGIGVLVTDDSGTITFSNEAASRFLGARRGEAVAEGRIREAIEQAILHRSEQAAEIELYTPRRQILGLEALPLEVWVGNPGAVVYITDLTEERRVEAMRRDFIANVSHELKTPLGALAVLAETLARHVDDPAVAARLAGRLGAEAARLAKLLEDILDLSRAEAQEGAGFQPVEIEELLADVAKASLDRAREFGVELGVGMAPAGASVLGDRRQLRAMLLNLVDNAVKYSDPAPEAPPPRVWIRSESDGAQVVIEVEDEGIGIPEAHLDRIFERFYRVDRGRSRATGGTGLGLSIVRNVAVNHGGTVEVESQLGRGSAFRVRLPLWREP